MLARWWRSDWTNADGVAGLPEVANPPQMLQPLSSTRWVAIVKPTSDELSPIEMPVLSRWDIAPRLLGVDGVANVTIWGQRERQLQVLVDPEVLRAQGVTLKEVISTTGDGLEVSPLSYLEALTPGTGGFVDTLNQRLQVFHEQTITSEEDVAPGDASLPLLSGGAEDRRVQRRRARLVQLKYYGPTWATSEAVGRARTRARRSSSSWRSSTSPPPRWPRFVAQPWRWRSRPT
jgi:hypothetical protein